MFSRIRPAAVAVASGARHCSNIGNSYSSLSTWGLLHQRRSIKSINTTRDKNALLADLPRSSTIPLLDPNPQTSLANINSVQASGRDFPTYASHTSEDRPTTTRISSTKLLSLLLRRERVTISRDKSRNVTRIEISTSKSVSNASLLSTNATANTANHVSICTAGPSVRRRKRVSSSEDDTPAPYDEANASAQPEEEYEVFVRNDSGIVRMFFNRCEIFVDGMRVIPSFQFSRIVLTTILNALFLIVLLYYLLSYIETLRKEFNITLGSRKLDAQALVYGVIGLNVLLFLMTRMPSGLRFQVQRLSFMPGETGVVPWIATMFCHTGMFHLLFNMVALNSFASPIANYFGPEHFLFIYLTSGIMGSLLVSLVELLFLREQRIHVGASGAILGLLGLFAYLKPDSQLHIIFLPNFTFSIQSGVYALLAFDTLGLLLSKTRLFRFIALSHGGHLGGILTGLLYGMYVRSNPPPRGYNFPLNEKNQEKIA